MNAKSIALAALVLATPACALGEAEMTDAESDAISSRVSLGAQTFVSKDAFRVTRSRKTKAGGWEEYQVDVRYRLHFVPAGKRGDDYRYDGAGALEYEAIIDAVEVGDPRATYAVDNTYYAKRSSNATFKLFDCDSTKNCSDGGPTSKITVVRSGAGAILRLSGLYSQKGGRSKGVALDGVTGTELVFESAPAPAEPAGLPKAYACDAGGYHVAMTPGENDSVDLEIQDASKKVVVKSKQWPSRDVATGDLFAVDTYDRTSFAMRGTRDGKAAHLAAHYTDALLGLDLEFAPGRCDFTAK